VVDWVSGTYAKIGNVDTVFCLKKIPLSDTDTTASSVYVTREKSRPFLGEACPPFTLSIVDGRGNCLDRGEMPIRLEPGKAVLSDLMPERAKAGRRANPFKDSKVAYALEYVAAEAKNGKRKGWKPTANEIAEAINRKFASKHDEKTVRQWLKGHKEDLRLVNELASGNSRNKQTAGRLGSER
jgi:hypothetical protein